MRIIECTKCGSTDLTEIDGFFVCDYCQSKFSPPAKATSINVTSDIDILLQKCETDPRNRTRYVNLILDIDPFNQEVRKYLN